MGNSERSRADAERERADAERARAEQLEAELAALKRQLDSAGGAGKELRMLQGFVGQAAERIKKGVKETCQKAGLSAGTPKLASSSSLHKDLEEAILAVE